MGKIFTTETTDSINVAMTVEPDCFYDRYTAEVQSADLKVWNEGTRLFCSVLAEIEIVDSESSREIATVSIAERKVALPFLSKQITYSTNDDFTSIEFISAFDLNAQDNIRDVLDKWLEIYVNIEGI